MDEVLQAVEEKIMQRRFPITYAVIKGNQAKEVPNWLPWYVGEPELESEDYPIFAQTWWERGEQAGEGADLLVASAVDAQLAENIVSSHNLVLEQVQKPDFGKS